MGPIHSWIRVLSVVSILSKNFSPYAGPVPMHCTRYIYQSLDVPDLRW